MGGISLILVLVSTFFVGFLLGMVWANRTQSKIFKKNYEKYKNAVAHETERVKQVQQQITEYYQELIRQEMYNHMLETAEAPPTKEEMN